MGERVGNSFGYAKGLAPAMWALVVIAAIELAVTHLVVSHWSAMVADALSALTMLVLGWMVVGIVGMTSRPVVLGDDLLLWRLGVFKSVAAPRTAVAGLRVAIDAAAVRDRATLNCSALGFPNVVVDLRVPVRRRRWGRAQAITALAHRLDDPAGFAQALDRWVVPA